MGPIRARHLLGHIISSRGIEADPAKIVVISQFPYPSCMREVRSFLAHVEFYRPFIKDFSKLSIHKQEDCERMAKFEKYMEMLQGKKEEPPIEKLTWDVLHQVRPTRHLEDKGCFTIPSPSQWKISLSTMHYLT